MGSKWLRYGMYGALIGFAIGFVAGFAQATSGSAVSRERTDRLLLTLNDLIKKLIGSGVDDDQATA